MRVALVVAIAVCACGRIAFDPFGDATVVPEDGPTAFCSGGPSACPAGAAFCDDFETSSGTTFPRWAATSIRNWSGGPADPATSVTADPAAACRVASGFHLRAAGPTQIAVLAVTVTPRPNPLYARLWTRIHGGSPMSGYDFFGFQNTNNDFILLDFDRENQRVGVNAQGLPPPLVGTTGVTMLPPDRWICVELRVVFDAGANGAVRIAIDGFTAIDVTNVTTDMALSLDRMLLGISSGTTPGTYDIDYDEIVVADTPIGCT